MQKRLLKAAILFSLIPACVFATGENSKTFEVKSIENPIIIKTPFLTESKKITKPENFEDDGEGKFIWVKTEDGKKGKMHFVYNKEDGTNIRAYIPKTEEYKLYEKSFLNESKKESVSELDITLENPEGRFFVSYGIRPDKIFYVNGELKGISDPKVNMIISKTLNLQETDGKDLEDNFSIKTNGIFSGIVGIKDTKNNKDITFKRVNISNDVKNYKLAKIKDYYEYSFIMPKE